MTPDYKFVWIDIVNVILLCPLAFGFLAIAKYKKQEQFLLMMAYVMLALLSANIVSLFHDLALLDDKTANIVFMIASFLSIIFMIVASYLLSKRDASLKGVAAILCGGTVLSTAKSYFDKGLPEWLTAALSFPLLTWIGALTSLAVLAFFAYCIWVNFGQARPVKSLIAFALLMATGLLQLFNPVLHESMLYIVILIVVGQAAFYLTLWLSWDGLPPKSPEEGGGRQPAYEPS